MRPSSAELSFCSFNCMYAALQASLRAACKLSGSLTIGRLENVRKGFFSFHRMDSSLPFLSVSETAGAGATAAVQLQPDL